MEPGAISNRTTTLESRTRFFRIVWIALLGAVVFYAMLPEISRAPLKTQNPTFFKIISAFAIGCIVICFLFRWRLTLPARATLVKDPTAVAVLRRWQTGHILHYSLSLTVALYGLVLRYAGFSLHQVLPFYVAGFVLLLYGMPRQPN